MVRCDDILQAVKEHKADFLGLSGLITPSLDEMIDNIKEFQKIGMDIPIMIGGATTSKAHTAVKIAPHYQGIVLHVNDASLVTEACSQVKKKGARERVHQDQEKVRERFHRQRERRRYDKITDARANAPKIDWNHAPPPPKVLGIREFSHSIEELSYIDWSPFFWSWGLKGHYPQILSSAKWGKEATKLYRDAESLLARIINENRFRPKALVGIWPANSQGDDVHFFESVDRSKTSSVFHF